MPYIYLKKCPRCQSVHSREVISAEEFDKLSECVNLHYDSSGDKETLTLMVSCGCNLSASSAKMAHQSASFSPAFA